MSSSPIDPAAILNGIREETRFELQLLHERVNTRLAAEAFLTIAYTATMNSEGTWAAIVAPVLAGLGLLLAALALPGVQMTAHLVMQWTYQIVTSLSGTQRHKLPGLPTSRTDAHGRPASAAACFCSASPH